MKGWLAIQITLPLTTLPVRSSSSTGLRCPPLLIALGCCYGFTPRTDPVNRLQVSKAISKFRLASNRIYPTFLPSSHHHGLRTDRNWWRCFHQETLFALKENQALHSRQQRFGTPLLGSLGSTRRKHLFRLPRSQFEKLGRHCGGHWLEAFGAGTFFPCWPLLWPPAPFFDSCVRVCRFVSLP